MELLRGFWRETDAQALVESTLLMLLGLVAAFFLVGIAAMLANVFRVAVNSIPGYGSMLTSPPVELPPSRSN